MKKYLLLMLLGCLLVSVNARPNEDEDRFDNEDEDQVDNDDTDQVDKDEDNHVDNEDEDIEDEDIEENSEQENVYSKRHVTHAHVHNCKHHIEPMGCYSDKRWSRTMPELLLTARDKTSDKYKEMYLNWKHYGDFLERFLCRCAEIAYKKGYSVIGLQYYGECWSGPKAHLQFDKHRRADTCIDSKFNKALSSRDTKCHAAIGGQNTNFVYRIRPSVCRIEYEPLGCYKDSLLKPRPLPNYIQNERDYTKSNWNHLLIDWKHWNTYSPQMICRCAKKALDMGYSLFSIQYWGECWSGETSVINYTRDGISKNCYAENFKKCPCNSYHCVGAAYTNYVYKVK